MLLIGCKLDLLGYSCYTVSNKWKLFCLYNEEQHEMTKLIKANKEVISNNAINDDVAKFVLLSPADMVEKYVASEQGIEIKGNELKNQTKVSAFMVNQYMISQCGQWDFWKLRGKKAITMNELKDSIKLGLINMKKKMHKFDKKTGADLGCFTEAEAKSNAHSCWSRICIDVEKEKEELEKKLKKALENKNLTQVQKDAKEILFCLRKMLKLLTDDIEGLVSQKYKKEWHGAYMSLGGTNDY